MLKTSTILTTSPSADYELIDSGGGEKLERFGTVVLSRPDPQALWIKKLPEVEWKKADGNFTREEKGGGWSLKPAVPKSWNITIENLVMQIKPTAFKHTGIFPEQSVNWEWMRDKIKGHQHVTQPFVVIPAKAGIQNGTLGKQKNSEQPTGVVTQHSNGSAESSILDHDRSLPRATTRGRYDTDTEEIEVLNLFGYTGGASLACAQAGASVVHIDSSKAAVTWARENAELSGLGDKPIRWIVEDVRVFVEREIKRGRKYDAIVMDPPAFGHGPTSELWKIEEHFLPLIENCKKLLKDKPLFFIINGYSAGYSAVAYENNLIDLKDKYGGEIEIGELAIAEKVSSDKLQVERSRGVSKNSTVEKTQGRLLPAGIFARWSIN